MTIFVSRSFLRKYKKLLKQNPRLREKIKNQLSIFQDNPNHPSLRLHKLQGKMITDWSISVGQDLRLIFTNVKDGILLVDIGKHEEVYKD